MKEREGAIVTEGVCMKGREGAIVTGKCLYEGKGRCQCDMEVSV